MLGFDLLRLIRQKYSGVRSGQLNLHNSSLHVYGSVCAALTDWSYKRGNVCEMNTTHFN